MLVKMVVLIENDLMNIISELKSLKNIYISLSTM